VERFTLAMEPEAVEAAFTESMFTTTPNGLAQAKKYWARIHERKHDALIMDQETTQAQLNDPWTHWETPNPQNSYDRLHELKMPVLVANGDQDILVPTKNSFELQDKIEGAFLHIYPDAGHAFLFQYGALFAKHLNLFLDME